jgi:hypothetical protein
MYSLVLNTRGASRQRSKCVLNSQLGSLALSLCGDPSRRYGCAKATPKRARQGRTAFFFCLAFSGLSFSTSAWCAALDGSSSSAGDQCMGFIMTGRPGGDAGVPYGADYATLAEAEQDALNRCDQTNLAEEGWSEACKTWCVHH